MRTLETDATKIVIQCAFCWAIKEHGIWREFHANLALIDDNVSHGACPPCYKNITGDEYVEKG